MQNTASLKLPPLSIEADQSLLGGLLVDNNAWDGVAPEQWGHLARQYSGQLLAYAHAVSSATRIPVIETWLFLPVAAGAARIVPG